MNEQELNKRLDDFANGKKTGAWEERRRVLAAIEKWKSEGRDEHDLWAMNNFLTGAGGFLTDTDLLVEHISSSAKAEGPKPERLYFDTRRSNERHPESGTAGTGREDRDQEQRAEAAQEGPEEAGVSAGADEVDPLK